MCIGTVEEQSSHVCAFEQLKDGVVMYMHWNS